MMTLKEESPKPNEYSDKEINDVSEWLEELSFAQLLYLKKSYEAMLAMQAIDMGSPYVH